MVNKRCRFCGGEYDNSSPRRCPGCGGNEWLVVPDSTPPLLVKPGLEAEPQPIAPSTRTDEEIAGFSPGGCLGSMFVSLIGFCLLLGGIFWLFRASMR